MLYLKLRFSPSHKDNYVSAGNLDIVFIDVTSRCNLNCRYCYNEDNVNSVKHDLPISLLSKMLSDKISDNISKWVLSGGEPLLYPDLDRALILFKQKNIQPRIATNGILLNPEVIDKWISLGVAAAQISIDTINEDKFIKLCGRNPELLKIILSNLHYSIKSPLRTVAASVLTSINLDDILNLIPYFYNIGVDSYTVYLYTPGSNLRVMSNHIIEFHDLPDIIEKIISKYYNICNTRIIDANIFPMIKTAIYEKWNSKLELRMHGCMAGQYSLSIKQNGKVSPCICQNADEFICGDLNKSNLSEIWNSPEMITYRSRCYKIPECVDCTHLSTCRAGCRNNAYLFDSKRLDAFDPLCRSLQKYNMTNVNKGL